MGTTATPRKARKIRAIRKPINTVGVTIRDQVIDPSKPVFFYVESQYGPICGRWEFLITEGYETLEEAVDFALNVWGDDVQTECWVAVMNDIDTTDEVNPREVKGFFGN